MYVFLRRMNLIVPFILTYDLDLGLNFQGHELCKITFWAIPRLLLGKHCQILTQCSLGKGIYIKRIKTYLEWVACETYASALRWQNLAKIYL